MNGNQGPSWNLCSPRLPLVLWVALSIPQRPQISVGFLFTLPPSPSAQPPGTCQSTACSSPPQTAPTEGCSGSVVSASPPATPGNALRATEWPSEPPAWSPAPPPRLQPRLASSGAS